MLHLIGLKISKETWFMFGSPHTSNSTEGTSSATSIVDFKSRWPPQAAALKKNYINFKKKYTQEL